MAVEKYKWVDCLGKGQRYLAMLHCEAAVKKGLRILGVIWNNKEIFFFFGGGGGGLLLMSG